MRRSLLILVTTILVLSGGAVWASLIWRAPQEAREEAAAVTQPSSSAPEPQPATTKGAVVVVVPPQATTTTTTRAEASKPSGPGFVPGGTVAVVGYRETAHASPNCTVVVTRISNQGTAPVGRVVLDFVYETGWMDASGTTFWRSATKFGSISRDDLDLAPAAETDVDWEVCVTEFEATTQSVRAEPLPETLDWTWKL